MSAAVPAWVASRRLAHLARIGWRGARIPTLDEVGQTEDLTRERVRQLQVKLEKRLGQTSPPSDEPIAQAAEMLQGWDAPTVRAGELLRRSGLTAWSLPDKGLELMFQLTNRAEAFERYQLRLQELQPERKHALRTAKDLTRSVGVACVQWVSDDCEGVPTPASVRVELAAAEWCHFLDEDWFWAPDAPRGRVRLVNLATKMLAACGPLGLVEVRDGLDRQVRLGRMPHLPSVPALRLFFAAHPSFSIDARDEVTSLLLLDPERELDTTERTLFRILSDAPDGFLDRADFFHQAVAAGVNPNTFSWV